MTTNHDSEQDGARRSRERTVAVLADIATLIGPAPVVTLARAA